jgi:hypothetical protein
MLHRMQRLFSMFPDGLAGVALLILRVCAGGSLLLCAFTRDQFHSASWAELGLGFLLVLIGVGALTPIACAGSVVIESIYALHSHGTDRLHAILALLVTLALGFLGPGALSIDAKLFGRRLIVTDED